MHNAKLAWFYVYVFNKRIAPLQSVASKIVPCNICVKFAGAQFKCKLSSPKSLISAHYLLHLFLLEGVQLVIYTFLFKKLRGRSHFGDFAVFYRHYVVTVLES